MAEVSVRPAPPSGPPTVTPTQQQPQQQQQLQQQLQQTVSNAIAGITAHKMNIGSGGLSGLAGHLAGLGSINNGTGDIIDIWPSSSPGTLQQQQQQQQQQPNSAAAAAALNLLSTSTASTRTTSSVTHDPSMMEKLVQDLQVRPRIVKNKQLQCQQNF
jgi:hypothetical protein